MGGVSADPTTSCPALFQILGPYLHQDWALEYESAEGALTEALAETPGPSHATALRELREHRPDRDDEVATREFVNLLCSYHPPGDGLSYVCWLDRVELLLATTMSPAEMKDEARAAAVALRDRVGTDRYTSMTHLRALFASDDQRKAVQHAICDHLADDREENECRYLLRFVWQLAMTYREVTPYELKLHVGLEKVNVVASLLDALADSPDAVGHWLDELLSSPIITDRTFYENRKDDGGSGS